MVPSTNFTVEVPKTWDDAEVTRLLQRYQDQPAVLSHVVKSIKARMITGQDIKTAQKRLKLIAGVVELFKLNREMQGILHDIHLAEKDFEINKVNRQITLEGAQSKLTAERQLRGRLDQLALQKEMLELEQAIDKIKNVPAPEPKLSPEQQRRLKRMEIEDRILELDRQEQNDLKTARDDNDRVRIQNRYEHRREELNEQRTRI